jgi:hypothetical protein
MLVVDTYTPRFAVVCVQIPTHQDTYTARLTAVVDTYTPRLTVTA